MSFTVRDRPPLRLSALVQAPRGGSTRWATDEPKSIYVPNNLTFATTMPGGYSTCSATLERDPRFSYADVPELAMLTLTGPGGGVGWQGRVEKLPDTAGFQAQETVEAFGCQAALEDDNTVREIFVDAELARWQEATLRRRIERVSAGITPVAPSTAPGPLGGLPALALAFTGPWASTGKPEAQAWYDANGIPIGSVYFAWTKGANVGTEAPWFHTAYLSNDDILGSYDELSPGLSESGTNTITATTASRLWAMLRFGYNAEGGADNVEYAIYNTAVAVYGRHGLPLQGTNGEGEWKGLLASDVVANAISRWVPGLATVIVPSSFVIEQLAFLEPTTVAEVIKQATRFELEDWAVWDGPTGPTFYMNPRGERGREWQARVGPAQLQDTGPQISRLWNGVAVQYTDVTGKQRTVGPPGFAGGASASEDPLLADSDPLNPLNETGERKWALLKMGTSTPEGAKAVGRRFLEEQKLLELSGQASIVGHVEDTQGNYWPAWAIKAGDTIRFLDAAISSPRRIVSTSYTDSSRTNALQIDQPPDALQALLERLSASLISTGLS